MPPEDNPEQDRRPLPQYKCHKVVGALKIGYVNHNFRDGSAELRPSVGYDYINVSAEFCRKHLPQDGGYYIVDEDGHASWSPAKAFEDGYDMIEKSDDTQGRMTIGEA